MNSRPPIPQPTTHDRALSGARLSPIRAESRVPRAAPDNRALSLSREATASNATDQRAIFPFSDRSLPSVKEYLAFLDGEFDDHPESNVISVADVIAPSQLPPIMQRRQ